MGGLRKLRILAAVLIVAALLSACSMSKAPKKVKLTMFIWAGANQGVVPQEVVAEYIKKNPHVEVEFIESSNAVVYPKMVAAKQTTPDQPMVNFGFFNVDATTKGFVDDMWLPLDEKIVTNLQDIFPQYRHPQNIGVAWGISDLAIIYNKNLVKTPPASWSELWSNPAFKKKVALWDYMFYSYMTPAIELGNTGATYENPDAAFKLWADNAAQIQSLVTSNDQVKNLLVSGEALAAPFFTKIAKTWIDEGAPLAIAIPKEGIVPFMLYFQVVKGSSPAQVKVANEIINEMLSPARLAKYAELTGTPVTNKNVKVPEKYKDDPSFSSEVIGKTLKPNWQIMARDNDKWKSNWDRMVKPKL